MMRFTKLLTAMVILAIALVGMAGADPFVPHWGIPTTVYDIGIGAGKDVKAWAGSGELDFGRATGDAKIGGKIYLNDTSIASGKYIMLGGLTTPLIGYSSANSGNITLSGKNVTIAKNLTITGSATIAGVAVNSGTIANDLTVTTPHNILQQGSGTTTTGTGIVRLEGNTLVGPQATKTLTVSGATTLASIAAVNGTSLFTGIATFTAAPVFNAGFTAPASQVIDTTTADKLKEAGVIVPTEIAVNAQLGNASNKTIFVADNGWSIVSIQERHDVVGPAGATYSIEKLKGTQVAGVWTATNGVNCMAAAGSLTSTINTVVTPALNGTTGNYAMVAGDALALVINGGHPGSVKGDVTVYLKRV